MQFCRNRQIHDHFTHRLSCHHAGQRRLRHAALACGVGQPALSKTLARLEQSAGLRLFERTARVVVPTAAGLRLAEHARKVCLALHDMESDMLGRWLTHHCRPW